MLVCILIHIAVFLLTLKTRSSSCFKHSLEGAPLPSDFLEMKRKITVYKSMNNRMTRTTTKVAYTAVRGYPLPVAYRFLFGGSMSSITPSIPRTSLLLNWRFPCVQDKEEKKDNRSALLVYEQFLMSQLSLVHTSHTTT